MFAYPSGHPPNLELEINDISPSWCQNLGRGLWENNLEKREFRLSDSQLIISISVNVLCKFSYLLVFHISSSSTWYCSTFQNIPVSWTIRHPDYEKRKSRLWKKIEFGFHCWWLQDYSERPRPCKVGQSNPGLLPLKSFNSWWLTTISQQEKIFSKDFWYHFKN